jgi:3-dehydroquinate synthase
LTDRIDNILIKEDIGLDIELYIRKNNYSRIFIIVDENTEIKCLPYISNILQSAFIIRIKSGDENKTIETSINIWSFLQDNGADKKSLIINLGGGVICDIGGFIASTFKRGISFINVPTTLLSQVDAGIGGKTGVNFNSIKNEIGTFNFPDFVFIDPVFLKTLDKCHFLSGFAEIIKYALIFDRNYWNLIKVIDVEHINFDNFLPIIQKSINIKKIFVKADPYDKGIRNALNFGHTFGHAFESLLMLGNKPVLHGLAVAQGIVFESFLSVLKLKLDVKDYREISDYITKFYGRLCLTEADFKLFYKILKHDKKNVNNFIKFTLLEEIGKYRLNNLVLKNEIFTTFTQYLNKHNL